MKLSQRSAFGGANVVMLSGDFAVFGLKSLNRMTE
jgi:hypothetical protein